MTDSNDLTKPNAPERIWVEDERPDGGTCHVYTEPSEGVLRHATPYILVASAEAAQALVVERAAEICEAERLLWQAKAEDKHEPASIRNGFLCRAGGHGADAKAIRALAPASGVAALATLRAERDAAKNRADGWKDSSDEGWRLVDVMRAERDDLRTRLAAAEAQVGALTQERDDLRECLAGADARNLKLGQRLQDANAALASADGGAK